MRDAGVLADGERTELIEGWIVSRMTRKPPHDARLDQANEVLRACVPNAYRLRVQSAITLSESEPEPDLAIVLGPANRYLERHPAPPDVALVVEIADSSLAFDRDDKGRIYARANIATYWIINLVEGQVEVYTNPTGPGPKPAYRVRTDHRMGDELVLSVEGETHTVRVSDLLG